MKKFLKWTAIVFIGLLVLGALAGNKDATTPPPGAQAQATATADPSFSDDPEPTAVPAPSGWMLEVSGAAGVQADCTWEVMQGASSHSGSRTVVTPATLELGEADIVSANCQKQDAGTHLLRLRLMQDGDLKGASDATSDYGIASVGSSS